MEPLNPSSPDKYIRRLNTSEQNNIEKDSVGNKQFVKLYIS